MTDHWQVIELAIQIGIRHFETVDVYGYPDKVEAMHAALAFVREQRRVPTERTPVAATTQLDEAIATLKLVYRKHHLGDDSIGWDELSERVLDTLSNLMGVDKLVEWQEGDDVD